MVGMVTIENTQLVLKNFAGEKGRYFNTSGNPEFAVVLPPELAKAMEKDGWNIKQFKPKEDDVNEPDFFIKVKVGVKGRPPRLVLINSKGRVDVDVDGCVVFDYVSAKNVDVILNPYSYEFQGATGISAYVQSLYVTVEEDELERKYADVPEAGAYQLPDEESDF